MEYTKIQSLFNNKDKVKHHSCVAYRGICSCGADYIGETIRNSQIRRNEHITGKDKNWDLSRASKNCLKGGVLH